MVYSTWPFICNNINLQKWQWQSEIRTQMLEVFWMSSVVNSREWRRPIPGNTQLHNCAYVTAWQPRHLLSNCGYSYLLFGLTFTYIWPLPSHLLVYYWIRIASIVTYNVLQSSTTHVNEGRKTGFTNARFCAVSGSRHPRSTCYSHVK